MAANSDKTVAYGVSADATPFEKGMADAANAAKNAAGNIDANFKKVGDAFAAVQKQLVVLAGIVAGGAFFKDAIAASNNLTAETMKLSKRLGITAEEAGTLNTALGDIGSSGDEYIDTFGKFARQLKNNEAGLQAMGLQTRDTNGNLRDSDTLFTEALQSVGQYKAGLDQNTAAQTLFGKSVDSVMTLQKLDNKVKEEAKQKNKELGLVITNDNVAASKAYKLAMNDVGDVLLAVKKTVGDAVMPVFTELGQYFASTGPAVVALFKGAMLGLLGAFDFVKAAVKTVAGVIFESISLMVDGAGLIGEVFSKLFSGDFSGAYASAKQLGSRFGQAVSGAFSNFMEAGDDVDKAMRKNYDRLYGDGGGMPGKPKAGPNTMDDFGKSNGKPKEEKPRTGAWEAELAEEKLAFQEKMNLEGSFAQYGKAAEAKFWQDRLALTTTGSAENLTVRRKMAELQLGLGQAAYQHELASLATQEAAYKNNTTAKLALLDQEAALVKQRFGTESKEYEDVQKKIVEAKRQATEQLKQIDLLRAQGARDANMAELQSRQQISQLELDLGVITQAQMLQRQRAFETDKNAIQLAALKEREQIALLDPDKNVVELARIHQEIQQLERAHQLRLNEIRGTAIKESQKYTLDAVNAMGNGFQSVFAKAMQGGLSLKGVMQGMWQAMSQAVTNALAKMAADWLMVQLKNLIFGKVAAQSGITAKAAEAGAGGVASMAAAPWPLNMTAPAFGAGMAAAAMSFSAMAAMPGLAVGSWNVPGDAFTKIHKGEMVVPSQFAENVRDGGVFSGGSGASESVINIHATGGDFIHKNDLAALLTKLDRKFAFVR